MSTLANKHCVPCKAGTPPLTGNELSHFAEQLSTGWRVIDGHHLEKEFRFKDFAQALTFTNDVGRIAEETGHHPDILLSWGRVQITLFTHKAGGLTENDFILAAKIDTGKRPL